MIATWSGAAMRPTRRPWAARARPSSNPHACDSPAEQYEQAVLTRKDDPTGATRDRCPRWPDGRMRPCTRFVCSVGVSSDSGDRRSRKIRQAALANARRQPKRADFGWTSPDDESMRISHEAVYRVVVGPELGPGGRDHPGRAQHHGQLPVYPYYPLWAIVVLTWTCSSSGPWPPTAASCGNRSDPGDGGGRQAPRRRACLLV
jgi:hypothetical protein